MSVLLSSKRLIDGGALFAERANAALGNVHAIFQANAKFAGDNHGLVTETHAGFQTGLVSFDEIGPFVNIQADAVTGAVDEASVACFISVRDDESGESDSVNVKDIIEIIED